MTDSGGHQRDRLQEQLNAFERHVISKPALKPAAVAIVVSTNSESSGIEFYLTLRKKGLSKHSGQFALPGGRVDDGETREQAAARELEEELNIVTMPGDIIGVLDDYATRSGFCITPVVFWCEQLDSVKPNPDEVAQVFRVPVSDLGHVDNPVLTDILQSPRPVLSLHLESIGHQVYSPTAAMLYQFHEVAICGRSTRVADFEQPVFAWK